MLSLVCWVQGQRNLACSTFQRALCTFACGVVLAKCTLGLNCAAEHKMC
jgi:hypothetical protein